jgi:hypothetical protein
MFSIFSSAALRRGVTLGAVLVLTVAQACSDSSSSTSPHNNNSDPRGTYALRTVDGKSVPQVINRSPFFDAVNTRFYNVYEVTVTDGGIELDELGNFYIWLDISVVGDGVALGTKHSEVQGTYQLQGSQVIVSVNGIPPGPLPIQNGEIDAPMDILGKGVTNAYVFRR